VLSSDDYTTFFRFPWSASPAGALNVFRSTYGPSDLRHQLTRRRIPRLTRCWKVPGWLAVKFPLMSQHRRSLDEFLCLKSNLGTHPTIVHLGLRLFCFLATVALVARRFYPVLIFHIGPKIRWTRSGAILRCLLMRRNRPTTSST